MNLDLSTFLPLLKLASKAAPVRSTMPVLSHVRLRSTAGSDVLVVVEATDLDVTFRAVLPRASNDGGGLVDVLLPPAFLKAINKAKGVLVLDASRPTWLDATGVRAFGMATLAPELYPVLARPEREVLATVPAADFLAAVAHVAPAVSTDDTRPNLCGVNVRLSRDAGVLFESTDGHRVHRSPRFGAVHEAAGASPAEREYLVPVRALTLAADALKRFKEPEVTIYQTAARAAGFDGAALRPLALIFKVGPCEVAARTIDWRFPYVDCAVPWNRPGTCATLTGDAGAFTAALVSLKPFLADRTAGIRLRVNGAAELSVSNPDVGTSTVAAGLEVTTHREDAPESGDEVGFNARYLLDACRAAADGRVTLDLSGARGPIPGDPYVIAGPVIIRSESGALAAVMPMRF